MAETKPFASLSSGLLARKGAAKPAMRPQGFGSFGGSLEDLGWNDMGAGPASLHDIHEAQDLPEHVPSSIDALTPAPGGRSHSEPPAVVEQQRSLEARLAPIEPEIEPEEAAEEAAEEVVEEEIEAQIESQIEAEIALEPEFHAEPELDDAPEIAPQIAPRPQRVRKAPAEAEIVSLPRSRATQGRAKAAFTLRLDPERHLKLRLACALSRRSAQQLVTEALDEFLGSRPELEALAGQVPGQANQR